MPSVGSTDSGSSAVNAGSTASLIHHNAHSTVSASVAENANGMPPTVATA